MFGTRWSIEKNQMKMEIYLNHPNH